MKKVISAIIVCILLVSVMLVLVSCTGGIDNGSYVSTKGDSIEIDGNKYTVTTTVSGEAITVTYVYEIKDSENNPDKQEIHLSFNSLSYSGSNPEITESFTSSDAFSLPYERTEDGFVINGVRFTKK